MSPRKNQPSKKSPMPQPTVADVVRAVDQFAPFRLAEEWDNVGLQIGDPAAPAGKVMVGLEVTPEMLEEATKAGARTLLVHHPLFFRPITTMNESQPVARLACEVIRRGMAMIAAHTNFDSVAYGTNGVLAEMMDMQAAGRRFLAPTPVRGESVKYVVFVPDSHAPVVIEAIASAGAGVIGRYSHCTFRSPGTGTYKPLEGANPYAGTVGALSQEAEVRLECVCPRGRLAALLAAVRRVHPYEEIAFDVYPLEPTEKATTGFGLAGELKKATTVGALAARLKKVLGLKTIGVVGDTRRKVATAAVCTGAGRDIVRGWVPGTADVFVTGELSHHDCAEAEARGMTVLLVGHWESEIISSPRMADLLRLALAERGFGEVDVIVSRKERNPLSAH